MHWLSCDGDPQTEIIGAGGGAPWVRLRGRGRRHGGEEEEELSNDLPRQRQAFGPSHYLPCSEALHSLLKDTLMHESHRHAGTIGRQTLQRENRSSTTLQQKQ